MSDQKKTTDLEQFLADNEAQEKEDVVADLKADRVNVNAFLSRVQATVKEEYRAQLEKLASDEQEAKTPVFMHGIADMSRETMLACFQRLKSGAFGDDYREAALARCRDKDVSQLSEEELRSWLEDVGDIIGDPES